MGAALCLLAAVIAWVLPGAALDGAAADLEPEIDVVGIEATSRAA